MKIQCDNEAQAQTVFDALNHYLAWEAVASQRADMVTAVVEAHAELVRLRTLNGTRD